MSFFCRDLDTVVHKSKIIAPIHKGFKPIIVPGPSRNYHIFNQMIYNEPFFIDIVIESKKSPRSHAALQTELW